MGVGGGAVLRRLLSVRRCAISSARRRYVGGLKVGVMTDTCSTSNVIRTVRLYDSGRGVVNFRKRVRGVLAGCARCGGVVGCVLS